MTEPVHDMPPSVAVEVTDHDGEQVRIRPHRPDERGTVAALEYRHDGSDDWVHVVALDPEDLARLSDFARILVWASHPGDAGADLRAALYGSTPVASTDPGVSRGLFQSLPATWDRWSAATPAGGGSGVVHALGPDGALRGGCTLQVGDEAATTWSQGALRVTCPACRSALALSLPVGVQRIGGERTIREDWQERRPGEPFPLDGYEELQGVPASSRYEDGPPDYPASAYPEALRGALPAFGQVIYPVTADLVELVARHRLAWWSCDGCHKGRVLPPGVRVSQVAAEAHGHQAGCPEYAAEYGVPARPTPWQTHSGDDDFPPHVEEAARALEEVHAAGDRDSETLCGVAVTDDLLVAVQDWRGHVTCRACREAAEL